MKWSIENGALRMKGARTAIVLVVAILLPILFFSCRRRPLENQGRLEARIRVEIDWSHSGIAVPALEEEDRVHCVSIRFFPLDGSPAFDCYLEGVEVTGGWIDVPIGKYAVVVFNERLYDAAYWRNAIFFSGEESYADFAAHAVEYTPAEAAEHFPFYTPQPDERTLQGPEPRRLASWSCDHFEVTANMTRPSASLSLYEEEMLAALTYIEMHRLTYMVNVTARVTNLYSTQANYCALSGLVSMVYMASREVVSTPAAVHLFTLNGRVPDPDGLSGITSRSFLSFGRTPPPEAYALTVDALYVTGEHYSPNLPDVTSQVTSGAGPDINMHVEYTVEYREGGITVNEWKGNYAYDVK